MKKNVWIAWYDPETGLYTFYRKGVAIIVDEIEECDIEVKLYNRGNLVGYISYLENRIVWKRKE